MEMENFCQNFYFLSKTKVLKLKKFNFSLDLFVKKYHLLKKKNQQQKKQNSEIQKLLNQVQINRANTFGRFAIPWFARPLHSKPISILLAV